MNNDEMKAFLQSIIAKTPFAAQLQAEVLSITPGRVELAVPVVPDRVNQHHGFVHGAVIGFVADSACAWAAGSVAGDVVTSEYKINFLAPAVGDRVIGVGTVVKASSRTVSTHPGASGLAGGRGHYRTGNRRWRSARRPSARQRGAVGARPM